MGPAGAINRTPAPPIISMPPRALLTLACLHVYFCVEAELHTCALYKRGCLLAERRRGEKKKEQKFHIYLAKLV